ncbi:MAG: TlpA family protein disulfide reductase [Planctomycetes bacterium]|nr:TlpA family protein disulfide reductase [Planctomycetota bacterium]
MLPHEKAMVERLKDKPFALLGLNSDKGGRDRLQQILKEQAITWRQSQDETTQPIAKEWNVTGWPTIYILDAKGVIRYKNLRNEAMEEAVMKLLDEAEKGK